MRCVVCEVMEGVCAIMHRYIHTSHSFIQCKLQYTALNTVQVAIYCTKYSASCNILH